MFIHEILRFAQDDKDKQMFISSQFPTNSKKVRIFSESIPKKS